jgi:hypothetical protein
MIRPDQFERLRGIIREARAAGNDDVLARALNILSDAATQAATEATPPPLRPLNPVSEPDPMTRAHAREDDGLHKLRKGRDSCSATRRDGEPCQAPAIDGGLVCRRHGGDAPQVQIAAKHLELQTSLHTATREFEEARGTPREFDALCRALQAQRDLDAYEVKMALLAELRAEVKPKRTAASR